MKRISLIALAAIPLLAPAQNKIDFPGRMLVEQARLAASADGTADMATLAAARTAYEVTVEVTDGNFDFGEGVEVVSTLGNLAIVRVTPSQIEQIAAIPAVRSIELGYDLKPLMNVARPAAGVNAVQQGTDGLDGKKFTGKGVICGLYDSGLDVNHVNFLDANGELRTKRVWTYGNSNGTYTTPSQIANFTTENSSATHGTHVLGIMAGGYNGPALYAVINNSAKVTQQTDPGSAMPYYGIATESDLAVACGTLGQTQVQNGMKNIVDYAKSTGQPCVINISLGNNLGPHDGSSTFSKWVAELGKDAVICFAAGNEGDENMSISTTGDQIKTFVTNTNSASGTIEFWGSDSQPFECKFIVFDRTSQKIVQEYTVDPTLGGSGVKLSDLQNISGSVTLSSNVNTANNRYNVSASISLSGISTCLPGFVITPKTASQSVEGFASATSDYATLLFASNSMPGYTDGSPANSINGLACGENIIVVGSYTTAAKWAILGSTNKGSILGYQVEPAVGQISSFSSYGTTFEGTKLPTVCAPGEAIVSSYSYYYVNAGNFSTANLSAKYDSGVTGLFARYSPWAYMQGTSMASPFVAGVVASWLQANPYLDVNQVKDIIAATSSKQLGNSARWGAGKIEALKGIKNVLSGVSDVTVGDNESLVLSDDGRTFDITVAGARRVDASIYSLSGARVAASSASGCNAVVSADGAVPGVYVLRIDTDKTSESRKIVIK